MKPAVGRQPQPQPQSPAPARRSRGRPRKSVVVESSPEPPSPAPVVDGNTGAKNIELEIGESQQSPAADSTLFVPEGSISESVGDQSPQLQPQHSELIVRVSDPPSSYDRGAYQRIRPQSNGTVSGLVDSSAPLPVINEDELPPTQQETDDSTTRIVPDSQSQGQVSEESTFRGFSPIQPQQAEIQSASIQGSRQRPEETSDLIADATQNTSVAAEFVGHDVHHGDAGNDNEQASGGAEQTESHTEEQYIVPEPSDPEPNQPHRHTTAESPRSLHGDTSGQEQSTAARNSSSREPISPEVRCQENSEKRLSTRSHIDSQGALADTIAGATQAAASQINDYIVISAEEDSSSLGLLTQPDYDPPPAAQRPPPSSLARGHCASLPVTQAKSGNEVASSTLLTQSPFPFQTQQTKVESESRPRAIFSQYPRSSPIHSSSQIPSVPFQSAITIGESAPARLGTPSTISTATMEENPLLAILRADRESGKARRKARRSNTPITNSNGSGQPASASAIPANVSAEVAASQAARQGARSPSTVPASEPEPSITKEEMRTSGRLPTLVPLVHETLSEDHSTLTVSETSKVRADPELASMHVVPISFGSIQRDQYKNGFQWYEGEIQQFLDGDDSPERFAKAESALGELRNIAMHPDLVNAEAYSQPLSTPEQAQWDVDASCKFRFLRDMLEQLRSRNIHVVLAANGHTIPEMLSNFLHSCGISHIRLSADSHSAITTGLTVSILELDTKHAVEHSRADVVVAMDGACKHQDRLIQAARCAGRDSGWATLLVLVVPCSVEHIERSLLSSIADTTRVRTLLKTARKLQLQELAGRLTPSQTTSKEAAKEIAGFLANPTDWPIEELGTIDNLDSQTETDVDPTLHGDSSFSAGKRSLEVEMETVTGGSSGKRPRVSSVEVQGTSQMPATINPQDIELTHISDSLGKVTQSAVGDVGSSAEVEQLRQILSDKHDELQEHVKAMSELQYRHEDQRVELAKTKNERNEAIITAQTAVTRMTLAVDQSVELRTERTALKQLLEEANSKVLNHAIPERREYENLRLAMEGEKLAREKAERGIEQAQKDNEYSREMYQDTSSRARELAQQNADLEARLDYAERLASGEQAKAQQATTSGRDLLLARENRKLKALLKDREAGMKFKDEEIARLKEAGRGRFGTRGSSVPRSPRMGSPALKGGRTSRQASPSAGELKGKHLHPLRNG